MTKPGTDGIVVSSKGNRFTGASKKHLLPLFKDDRFNLKIKGEGWVVKQSPAPGTPVEPGMTLEFELK